MHSTIAHHLSKNAQSLSSACPSGQFPSVLKFFSHDGIWYEIPLWTSPSQLFWFFSLSAPYAPQALTGSSV